MNINRCQKWVNIDLLLGGSVNYNVIGYSIVITVLIVTGSAMMNSSLHRVHTCSSGFSCMVHNRGGCMVGVGMFLCLPTGSYKSCTWHPR